MAFCVTYERKDGVFCFEAQNEERSTPSPIRFSKKGDSACIGEVFSGSLEGLFDSNWVSDPSLLNKPDLAIAMVRYDESGCYFATNYSALEPLYFYKSDKFFILSDDFWAICKKIKPSFDDLDVDVIARKIALCGAMCECASMVKGLEWVPGNRWGHFDAKTGEFELKPFSRFVHSNRDRSIDEVVDEVDAKINEGMKGLVKAFPGKTFGLGLSGGLDSRAALHYLLANGAKVACFNQCTKRPHGVLLANSLKRAHEIAKASGVSCVDVDWKSNDIAEKKELQMRLAPLALTDNVYKYETAGMPDYDVLITGGAGAALIVGGLPDGVSNYSKKDLVDCIMASLMDFSSPYSIDQMIVTTWLVAHGLKKDSGDKYKEVWDRVAGEEVYANVRRNVEIYVDDLLSEGVSAADVLFEYDSIYSVGLTRHGAFETGFGQYRSFCYNRPFIIDLVNDVPVKFLENRLILRELIKRKMPEFEGIAEENYGSADGKKKSGIASFLGKIEFFVRGTGVRSVEWHAKDAAVKKAFFNDMQNQCEWFYRAFDLSDDVKSIWRMSPMRKNAIWDMKRFVDCVETQRYLDF